MASFLSSLASSATSLWDNPQLSTLGSNAVSFLDYTRIELEKSKLGLNWTLVLMVLLSIIPAIILRNWVSGRYTLLHGAFNHLIHVLLCCSFSSLPYLVGFTAKFL